MNKEDQDKVLKRAIKQYGAISQADMCTEECAELIKAINKMKRIGGFSIQRGVVYHPKQGTDIKYCIEYYNLCSEVADVRIMLRQMELMLNKEAIDIAEDRKINRLVERMNFDELSK